MFKHPRGIYEAEKTRHIGVGGRPDEESDSGKEGQEEEAEG